jgi:hypothetical protein
VGLIDEKTDCRKSRATELFLFLSADNKLLSDDNILCYQLVMLNVVS